MSVTGARYRARRAEAPFSARPPLPGPAAPASGGSPPCSGSPRAERRRPRPGRQPRPPWRHRGAAPRGTPRPRGPQRDRRHRPQGEASRPHHPARHGDRHRHPGDGEVDGVAGAELQVALPGARRRGAAPRPPAPTRPAASTVVARAPTAKNSSAGIAPPGGVDDGPQRHQHRGQVGGVDRHAPAAVEAAPGLALQGGPGQGGAILAVRLRSPSGRFERQRQAAKRPSEAGFRSRNPGRAGPAPPAAVRGSSQVPVEGQGGPPPGGYGRHHGGRAAGGVSPGEDPGQRAWPPSRRRSPSEPRGSTGTRAGVPQVGPLADGQHHLVGRHRDAPAPFQDRSEAARGVEHRGASGQFHAGQGPAAHHHPMRAPGRQDLHPLPEGLLHVLGEGRHLVAPLEAGDGDLRGAQAQRRDGHVEGHAAPADHQHPPAGRGHRPLAYAAQEVEARGQQVLVRPGPGPSAPRRRWPGRPRRGASRSVRSDSPGPPTRAPNRKAMPMPSRAATWRRTTSPGRR